MQKNSQNFSMQEALRLAKSDAGQQLLAILKSADGTQLQQAMQLASAGNYEQAKQILSSVLSSPEAKALLKELEG